MAVTVSSLMTTLDPAEAVTNWNAHNIVGTMGALAAIDATDEEMPPKQGTYCLAWDIDIETGGYYYAFTATDYSDKIVYIWASAFTAASLEVSNPGAGQSGVFIIARDSSGNYGYWHVGGSDTYPGGWRCFVADLSQAPDTHSGTAPNLANCDGIGLGFRHLAKSKATHNVFIDFLRITNKGDGLKVATSAASVADWDDLYVGDESISAGIIRKVAGVYFVQGPIQFGDVTTGDVEFKDTSQVVVFEDASLSDGHYELKVVGNASGTIKFQMGNKSGERGIQGCTVTGTLPFKVTATDTDIDEFKLYGCTLANVGLTSLPPNAAGREVIDTTWLDSSEVVADTCIVKYCSFVNSDDRGVRISSTSHNVTDCTFINCGHGTHVSVEGAYTFSALSFSGCTYDVENSTSATQVDAYADTNRDTAVQLYSGGTTRTAQSFVATAGKLSRAIFSLQKVGVPTGNVVAKLYADTGGSGPGTLLATSNNVVIGDIGTSWAQVDFEFEDAFTLVATTLYWISVEYVDGDSSNRLEVGVDNSSPGHSGSCYTYTGSWGSQAYDMCFYVNRDGIVNISLTNGSNASTAEETAAVKGATIPLSAYTITVTVQDEDTDPIVGVQTGIYKVSDRAELMNEDTNAQGVATEPYAGGIPVDVEVRCRKASGGAPKYVNFSTLGQINGDFNLLVTMKEDPYNSATG